MALTTSHRTTPSPPHLTTRRARYSWLWLSVIVITMISVVTASTIKDKLMLARRQGPHVGAVADAPPMELQTNRGLKQIGQSARPVAATLTPQSPPPPFVEQPPSTTPPSSSAASSTVVESTTTSPPPPPTLSRLTPMNASNRRWPAIPTQPMAGPLCVFIPANGHDEKHLKEVEAVLEAWGDASTLLFTENPLVMERTEEVATRKGIARALVEMEDWKKWQQELVLAHASLRRRGATADSIRGRGQLSIPLFYWISQLVKQNNTLVQNCKWFMKCDTDTYLRRKLLEATVLSRFDPDRPYHVGVPLHFNTRPFHHTLRHIAFQYNIGGPGYTFSRGLMNTVNVDECIESMTRDPVLLIHDDVATGYCATYHARHSMRENAGPTFTSSLHQTASILISSSQTVVTNTAAAVASPSSADAPVDCLQCFVALHPVRPFGMQALAKLDAARRNDDSASWPSCPTAMDECAVSLMLGFKSEVGKAVHLPSPLDNVAKYWHNAQVWTLPFQERRAAGEAKELIDAWKHE